MSGQRRSRMRDATDTEYAPWYIVRSYDKRRARLNCIAHLLSHIPHEPVPRPGCGWQRAQRKAPMMTERPWNCAVGSRTSEGGRVAW